MSVRRRAIRARVERDAAFKKGRDAMTRDLGAVLDLCDRKRAAGETAITPAEVADAIQRVQPCMALREVTSSNERDRENGSHYTDDERHFE